MYNAVTNIAAFVRPLHPGSFVASGTRLTAAKISQEKVEHDELLRVYNECHIIEKLLKIQLVDVVSSAYIDSTRDDDTLLFGW